MDWIHMFVKDLEMCMFIYCVVLIAPIPYALRMVCCKLQPVIVIKLNFITKWQFLWVHCSYWKLWSNSTLNINKIELLRNWTLCIQKQIPSNPWVLMLCKLLILLSVSDLSANFKRVIRVNANIPTPIFWNFDFMYRYFV